MRLAVREREERHEREEASATRVAITAFKRLNIKRTNKQHLILSSKMKKWRDEWWRGDFGNVVCLTGEKKATRELLDVPCIFLCEPLKLQR